MVATYSDHCIYCGASWFACIIVGFSRTEAAHEISGEGLCSHVCQGHVPAVLAAGLMVHPAGHPKLSNPKPYKPYNPKPLNP